MNSVLVSGDTEFVMRGRRHAAVVALMSAMTVLVGVSFLCCRSLETRTGRRARVLLGYLMILVLAVPALLIVGRVAHHDHEELQ